MSVAERQVIIAAAKAAHDAKKAGRAPAQPKSSGSELLTAAAVAVILVATVALAVWRNG